MSIWEFFDLHTYMCVIVWSACEHGDEIVVVLCPTK